jgi:TetR/AcrR family transcriptional regulator, transcriptional repressor for nem operon
MNSTREIILQKAFMLFLQNSYDSMSMIKLQEETGLSRGALYHHFKSKEQLFIEVIEKFYIATPTTPNKPLDIHTLYGFYHDYFEHVIGVFKILRESMQATNPDSDFNLFSLGLEAMKRYPGFREKIRTINIEVRKIWIHVVKTARESGEIVSVMSDEQIANCFVYLNEGIGTRFTMEGRGNEADKELLELWDCFYNQIKIK